MTATFQSHAMLALVALLALWGIATWAGGSESRLAARLIFQFFGTIALPVAAAMGLMLLALARVTNLDERVWQAMIAGLFIATGWLTTAVFSANAERRLKAEKLRDYHKALYAEIGNTLAAYYGDGRADDYARDIVVRMETDADFVPFIPRETHDRVFAALLEEIEVLPRQTIDAVIAFYGLVTSVEALADDMRGERFLTLEQVRRIAIYRDYIDMRVRARQLGEYALRLIKAFGEGGAPAAEAVAQAFNSPDGVQRRPSAGSV